MNKVTERDKRKFNVCTQTRAPQEGRQHSSNQHGKASMTEYKVCYEKKEGKAAQLSTRHKKDLGKNGAGRAHGPGPVSSPGEREDGRRKGKPR